MLGVVDGGRKGYGHHAKGFGLEELHRRSNVLFHELRYLPFGAVGRPFFPNLLLASSVAAAVSLIGIGCIYDINGGLMIKKCVRKVWDVANWMINHLN